MRAVFFVVSFIAKLLHCVIVTFERKEIMPLTYREAVKLIKKQGGKFIRHGGEHDIFMMPWGTSVTVPRHKKEFSRGVEDDIRKRISGQRKD